MASSVSVSISLSMMNVVCDVVVTGSSLTRQRGYILMINTKVAEARDGRVLPTSGRNCSPCRRPAMSSEKGDRKDDALPVSETTLQLERGRASLRHYLWVCVPFS